MRAKFKCRTCGTLFTPHESTHFSELYCSPVCWESWDRYRKRLDNFKRSMDAYNNGERANPPKQPAGLHIPEEDECERSRQEILAAMRRRAGAKEQRTEKRGRKPKPKEEQPPYKEYTATRHGGGTTPACAIPAALRATTTGVRAVRPSAGRSTA